MPDDVAAAIIALVHHADAVGPDVDPQRPLSAAGRRQAEWLAEHARAAGLRPAAIWHSGKLRARQTAEAFLGACNPFAEFKAMRGLRPDDAPDWIRDVLEEQSASVLIVSHMPLLPALLRRLVPDAANFPLHGMVVIERTDERYVERWRIEPPAR